MSRISLSELEFLNKIIDIQLELLYISATSGTGKEVSAQSTEMMDALKSIISDYKSFSTMKNIFSVHDTAFATCATFANYVLDKLGLLKPLLKIKVSVSSR
jgi:hypothetical protein